MRIHPIDVAGAALVELDLREDERGFFARSFDAQEFQAAGLEPAVDQANVSFNHLAGTLRGMHWQVDPAPEAKLVRCTRGAVRDAVVDMRPGSPTYLAHHLVDLTADNRVALYLPPGCAHGYLTLVDGTEVSYQVSGRYSPDHERGARYDDPALGLDWGHPVTSVSDKDRSWPLLPPRS